MVVVPSPPSVLLTEVPSDAGCVDGEKLAAEQRSLSHPSEKRYAKFGGRTIKTEALRASTSALLHVKVPSPAEINFNMLRLSAW